MTILVVPLAAYASTLNVPYDFVNGTPANADEVNANFSAVESAVNDNHNRISTLESAPPPGDITDVLAGSGLSGGGSSGSVILSVAPNGIDSSHLQDGSITGADILSTTTATLGGLVVNGSSSVNNVFNANEIRLTNDNANLRFYNGAGTGQTSVLFSEGADKYFYDFGQGRYVFRSNSNGLGIGTSPSVGAAVTMTSLQVDSLQVSGNASLG